MSYTELDALREDIEAGIVTKEYYETWHDRLNYKIPIFEPLLPVSEIDPELMSRARGQVKKPLKISQPQFNTKKLKSPKVTKISSRLAKKCNSKYKSVYQLMNLFYGGLSWKLSGF